MDLCKGDILLVGEGDFSFSVAFVRRLHNAKRQTRIISSSFPGKEELYSIHKSAPDNIKIIQELGVTVLHEVDATHLEQYETINHLKFDYLLFNFPHTGGKSNIKKNRQLLRDFFFSAKKVLKPDSSILISLARGQGGTPVDQPVRAWHDSWQVVAMAAYVNLVMYDVKPFVTSEWQEYCSTGFRSMDRSFFMGGAFTYCFRRALPLSVRTDHVNELKTCSIDGRDMRIIQYIADKVNRNLLHISHHPVSLICKALEHFITMNFDKEQMTNMGNISEKVLDTADLCSLYDQHSLKASHSILEENEVNFKSSCDGLLAVNEVIQVKDNTKDPTVTDIEQQRKSMIHPYFYVYESDNSTVNCSMQNSRESNFVLRSTLLDCRRLFKALGKDPKEKISFGFGDVFRRTWVDSVSLPVEHEFLLLFKNYSMDLVEEKIRTMIQSILPNCNVYIDKNRTCNIPYWCERSMSSSWSVEIGYKSVNFCHTLSCNQVGPKGPAVVHRDASKHSKFSKVVAYMGELKPSALLSSRLSGGSVSNEHILAVVLNLDSLSQVKYDIPDQRLLWSENEEFLKQFNDVNINDTYTYQPMSYHPPLWRHDLSFWERDDEMFNEQKFLDIVCNISGDALDQVILMNVWRDPESQRMSKCYRQVYQSHDRPISHEKAHEFQNALRLNVEKYLRVELR